MDRRWIYLLALMALAFVSALAYRVESRVDALEARVERLEGR